MIPPGFAAEAAARRLPLKRQCSARLRVDAEPRVYPRPSEAAMRCALIWFCRSCSLLPAPCSLLLPGRRAPPSLHDRPPIPSAAAIRLHSALRLAALGRQRSPRDHAALTVAAVVPTTTVLGHAAAGHTLIRFQLIPQRRCGRAGCGLTGAIVPRDREQLVASRAAQRGRMTVRRVRPMAAARADQVRIGPILRSGHGPLARGGVAQLEKGAGHRHGATPEPQLHLSWRESYDGVPRAPSQPTACGCLQPGPLSDTHSSPRC